LEIYHADTIPDNPDDPGLQMMRGLAAGFQQIFFMNGSVSCELQNHLFYGNICPKFSNDNAENQNTASKEKM
jgi:hypothetical protein